MYRYLSRRCSVHRDLFVVIFLFVVALRTKISFVVALCTISLLVAQSTEFILVVAQNNEITSAVALCTDISWHCSTIVAALRG